MTFLLNRCLSRVTFVDGPSLDGGPGFPPLSYETEPKPSGAEVAAAKLGNNGAPTIALQPTMPSPRTPPTPERHNIFRTPAKRIMFANI